jgi:ferredoxin/coenzyme F420-reducing hydrogenase delta subunit
MFQADPLLPLPVAGPATPPARPPERWPRRALFRVGTLYQQLEAALDRVLSAPLNPLYHTGTIAVFSLAVATVTGLYLFLFYRIGTSAAHASVEAIVAQPLGLGALMRSLHRYSSDAALAAAALHGLKMLLTDRFWGARWTGWVTGLALMALVWFTGATGYWLVWDMQALVLSVTTARFIDVLPFFAEPIVHTFLRNDRIQSFLFFIVLFLHITVPLVIGAFYWLHVMRLSRARFLPPRVVLWVTGVALLGASLLRPALSGPPADPALLPGTIPVDWFYFGYFPLTRLDPRTGWTIVAGTGALVLSLPWLLRGRGPALARVETAACTGCTRCYKDCPYDAITMVPRGDGGRPRTEAVVNPARCVGCGICVGACDTGGILLGGQSPRVLAGAVMGRLATARAAVLGAPVLVFACRLMRHLASRLEADGSLRDLPAATVLGLPCVGVLHPDLIRQALGAGAAGVYIAACHPEDCQFREGSAWLSARLAGARLPALKGAPAERVRVGYFSPVEVGRFLRELDAFRRGLPMTPIVPDRRPTTARITGFLALLTAISWALGTFAAWPWSATSPDEARLRISLRHVSDFTGAPRPDLDVETRPRHMRPIDGMRPMTGPRADARLTVSIGGRPVLARTYRPTGLRRDGPVYAYEEITVTPGRHRVAVTLAEVGATDRRWSIEYQVEFRPGSAPLVEYEPGRGWLVQHGGE